MTKTATRRARESSTDGGYVKEEYDPRFFAKIALLSIAVLISIELAIFFTYPQPVHADTASDLLLAVATTSGSIFNASTPLWEMFLGVLLSLWAVYAIVGAFRGVLKRL